MHDRLRFLSGVSSVILVLGSIGCGSDNGSKADTTAPSLDALFLNGGIPYTLSTTITVSMSCSDNERVRSVILSEDTAFEGTEWQEYQSSVQFELSAGDGIKTVYAQVKDATGNTSEIASAEVVLAASTTYVGLKQSYIDSAEETRDFPAPILELWIANVTDMFSGRFKLSFNPDELEVAIVDVDLTDHIMKMNGSSIFPTNVGFDNESGEITVGAQPLPPFEPVTGSGLFARITFMPPQTLSVASAVAFVEGEFTAIYQDQGDTPPIELEGVVFLDGAIEP